MKKITFLLIFLSFSLEAQTLKSLEDKQKYLEFLEIKKEILTYNLENIRRPNFVPREVLWDDIKGILVVPKHDPYVQKKEPKNPYSDKLGMVSYPNMNAKLLRKQIKTTEKAIIEFTKKNSLKRMKP